MENEEDREWVDKWFSPFDPRESGEETGNGNGNEEEGATEEGAESEPEEARRVKTAKLPAKPSKEEVDEHMVTHLPFRSWCPH